MPRSVSLTIIIAAAIITTAIAAASGSAGLLHGVYAERREAAYEGMINAQTSQADIELSRALLDLTEEVRKVSQDQALKDGMAQNANAAQERLDVLALSGHFETLFLRLNPNTWRAASLEANPEALKAVRKWAINGDILGAGVVMDAPIPSLIASAPILHDGAEVGRVYATLRLRDALRPLRELFSQNATAAFGMTKTGFLHLNGETAQMRFETTDCFKNALICPAQLGEVDGRIARTPTFPNIAIFASRAAINAAAWESALLAVGMIAVAALCAGVLGVWLARSIGAPLRNLRREARLLANGQLSADDLGLRRRRNISEIDSLSQTLRKAFKELERAAALKKYRSLFNQLGEAAFVLDAQGRILDANDVAGQLLSVPRDALPGELLSKRLSNANLEDFSAQLRRALAGQTIERNLPVTCHSAEGARIPAELHFRPIELEDQPAVLVLGFDLNKRRTAEMAHAAAEERFQALIERSPAAIAIKEPDGRVMSNSRWNEWFNGGEEPKGAWTPECTFPPETARKIVQQEAEILAQGAHCASSEDEPLPQNGGIFIRSQRFPVPAPNGGVAGVGEIHTDVTDLRRAQENLRRSMLEAEAANQAKSTFLANMSHELRTPLNAVIGFSEVMKDQMLGEMGNAMYLDYASDIHNSGKHLLDIINDILDLSKVEAGQQDLRDECVDLAEIMRETARTLEPRAERERVSLNMDALHQAPPVRGDRTKLKQILLNMLSNAVKFSHQNGEVRGVVQYSEETGYQIEVADDGIGIPADKIETALSPFGQVDDALNRKYEGTGLGLPLCVALAELHDGSLELLSKEGEGTRVIVHLPTSRQWKGETPAQQTADAG